MDTGLVQTATPRRARPAAMAKPRQNDKVVPMKKTLSLVLIACITVLSLAACGGSESSSQAAPASVAPASEATPASEAASGAESTAESTPAAADVDLDAALASMVEAAELGGTITVSEIDLKAGGVDVENVESFVGAQSQLAAQNGGIVIIIKAAAGTGETVASDMESFRQYSLGNADYEEFEDARNNTESGIIKTYGDYVVYAVSATGNVDAVTTAADAQFA